MFMEKFKETKHIVLDLLTYKIDATVEDIQCYSLLQSFYILHRTAIIQNYKQFGAKMEIKDKLG